MMLGCNKADSWVCATVISDPNDSNFDLEKYILKRDKEQWK